MALPPPVLPDPTWAPEAVAATTRYRELAARLQDRSYWPVLMHINVNLFLWHLAAFEKDEDPIPLFVDAFDRASSLAEAALAGPCQNLFPAAGQTEDSFEAKVSGLFSDVWVAMSDDIYFDETYAFTRERFEKNGLDPEKVFGGKVVVDAGCGSGKFSAAIARLGAAKVIGLDIGAKGLDFARQQAAKMPYGDRLDYRHGSLLDIPLENQSVDMVWSNGVIHHTLGYERCIEEFARILKPGGTLYLYVNGRFGLWELLCDTLRLAQQPVPRLLTQHFLSLLGINTGRIYWMMDMLHAPYEWKAAKDVEALLEKHGFGDLFQMTRGVAIDQIEQITTGLPHAKVKYGEGQLKFIVKKY